MHPAFLILLLFAYVLMWISAILSILQNKFKDPGSKPAWLIAVIFIPMLGTFLYFIIGLDQRELDNR